MEPEIRQRLIRAMRGTKEPRRLVRLEAPPARKRGHALLSYLAEPVTFSENDPRLRGHTNKWESREFARALRDRGWTTDVVDFDFLGWEPRERYDVVVAVDAELIRLKDELDPEMAFVHMTGASPAFQNSAELTRIEELVERRGIECLPRRMVPDPESSARAQELADSCSLVGNDWTLSTFSPAVRAKTTTINVTASPFRSLGALRRRSPSPGDFLWFFGAGAIHKGLDRVLEVFAGEPRLGLHVVGNIAGEDDFVGAYEAELFGLPNITFHGELDPMSRAFARVIDRCSAFVAPSCSEGMSPSCATLLQAGLFPILSRETGITLPDGKGIYLDESSIEEIRDAVTRFSTTPDKELESAVAEIQADALERYSREGFAASIRRYLAAAGA